MATLPALQYLDKALAQVRDMGLKTESSGQDPIVALLEQIVDLDKDKVTIIARTLAEASTFNEIVRNEISAMKIGERYNDIVESFNSIRDDAKSLVDQLEDGRISTFERVNNVWMKVSRGDVAQRFDKIQKTYLAVASDSADQIKREQRILAAYQDYRGAYKQAQILALEVLKKAEAKLEVAKKALTAASEVVSGFAGSDPAERAKLELARDEKLRGMQDEDKRYQIAKDLADNLTVGYNTTEVIMARLLQTTNAKERVYQQAITFFSTNEAVLTALKASFTGLFGLHESTATLEAMKKGVSDSLETIGEIGNQVQEAAVKAGYGPTVRADAVKKLVDSIVSFQERSRHIIKEMRTMASRNSEEINEAVEDGKRRLAQLAVDAAALE
ncbi:MAG: cell surface protein [Hyphomicrobiaceae bacterium]